MFSPITETAAREPVTFTGRRAPAEISREKAPSSTAFAFIASAELTPIDIPVSEADWHTRKALILSSARAVNILQLTPTRPAIEVPERVIRLTSSIEEIPRMDLSDAPTSARMVVPVP